MDLLVGLDVCTPISPSIADQPRAVVHGPVLEHGGTPGMMPEDLGVLCGGAVRELCHEAQVHCPCLGGCGPELGNLRSCSQHHPWGQALR